MQYFLKIAMSVKFKNREHIDLVLKLIENPKAKGNQLQSSLLNCKRVPN